jgi:acetylornithine aminotransferase
MPAPAPAPGLLAQVQYKTPFMPVMPGHVLAEYNNLDSARKAIQKGKTAAVFVEPVQGGWQLRAHHSTC